MSASYENNRAPETRAALTLGKIMLMAVYVWQRLLESAIKLWYIYTYFFLDERDLLSSKTCLVYRKRRLKLASSALWVKISHLHLAASWLKTLFLKIEVILVLGRNVGFKKWVPLCFRVSPSAQSTTQQPKQNTAARTRLNVTTFLYARRKARVVSLSTLMAVDVKMVVGLKITPEPPPTYWL